MNQQLKEAKRSIRTFIRAHFDDQRLHEVIAFNDDSKMFYNNSCCCLLGVTLSSVLHQSSVDDRCDMTHYDCAAGLSDSAVAEYGYWSLGRPFDDMANTSERRNRRLGAILKAESRRRHRIATKELAAPETVLVGESI